MALGFLPYGEVLAPRLDLQGQVTGRGTLSPRCRCAPVVRDGTAVFMVAQNLDRGSLPDVAASLVPVDPDRPGLAPPGAGA